MDLTTFLQKLDISEAGVSTFFAIHECRQDAAFRGAVLRAEGEYKKSDEAFGEYISLLASRTGYAPEQLTLYIYILVAYKAYNEYIDRGMDAQIFFDTMSVLDIVSKLQESKNGVYGIPQQIYRAWLRRELGGTIYRLGALEFELKSCPIDIPSFNISKHDTVLSVHIPRKVDLSETYCEASYDMARKFFKQHYGIERCVFICESWLLHPWLQDALNSSSSIVAFQKKYTILSVKTDYREVLQWVFPRFEDCDIDSLPQDTTLRRVAVEKMKSNVPIGSALGARI